MKATISQIDYARTLGKRDGLEAAKRYNLDPLNFDDTPCPFGVDTQTEQAEEWFNRYENALEGNKRNVQLVMKGWLSLSGDSMSR